jgi:hypothetical protein
VQPAIAFAKTNAGMITNQAFPFLNTNIYTTTLDCIKVFVFLGKITR